MYFVLRKMVQVRIILHLAWLLFIGLAADLNVLLTSLYRDKRQHKMDYLRTLTRALEVDPGGECSEVCFALFSSLVGAVVQILMIDMFTA